MTKQTRRKFNLVGQVFGRLTVIARAAHNKNGSAWTCKCECGNTTTCLGKNLVYGKSKSCGCGIRDGVIRRNREEGHTGVVDDPAYNIWKSMKFRCRSKTARNAHRYAARGICVCDGWHDFGNFTYDMGPRPGRRFSIDRINNDGGYWCGLCQECRVMGWRKNCRWATQKEQCRNTSVCRYIEFNGTTRTLSEWCELSGMCDSTLGARLDRGMSLGDALYCRV